MLHFNIWMGLFGFRQANVGALDYRMVGIEVAIGGGVEHFRKINNRELE